MSQTLLQPDAHYPRVGWLDLYLELTISDTNLAKNKSSFYYWLEKYIKSDYQDCEHLFVIPV